MQQAEAGKLAFVREQLFFAVTDAYPEGHQLFFSVTDAVHPSRYTQNVEANATISPCAVSKEKNKDVFYTDKTGTQRSVQE